MRWWAVLVVVAGCAGEGALDQWRAVEDPYDFRDDGRCGVLSTIRDDVLRPGMTPAEVEALLGPAEAGAGATLVYGVGACSYGVDFDQLVITFTDGALTETSLTRT